MSKATTSYLRLLVFDSSNGINDGQQIIEDQDTTESLVEDTEAHCPLKDDIEYDYKFENVKLKTCQRLHDFIKSKQLWYKIDARDSLNISENIEFCIERITDTTKDVRICADGRHIKIIPDYFFKNLSTLNLTVLALENQKICGKQITLKEFPESLIELSLKKTHITDAAEFSKYNPGIFKNLKVLILDQCVWFTGHMLDRFQNLDSLEIISVYKCRGLYDIDLIRILQKFNRLRIADCRFSGLGNKFLKCLAKKPSVQEIYFQDYLTTYFLEKEEREMEIANGSQKLKNSYISELDDIPLWNEDILHNFVGPTSKIEKIPYGHLSQTSTELYSSANPIQENYNVPSILYQRPYNECTCQNDPYFATDSPPNKKRLTVSNEDIERKVCRGGYIYTLERTANSNVTGMSQSDSTDGLENVDQNEKDIAVLEHTSHCRFKFPTRYYRMVVPGSFRWRGAREESNEYEEPRWVNKCGNADMYDRHYYNKKNDVCLKKLSLRGCTGVTDETLVHLKNFNLSLLDITSTRVTVEGVQNFALENLDCRIIHETMCTCRPKMHF